MQQSLFAVPTEAPDKGYTRHEITVAGHRLYADFNPAYLGGLGHIAFQSLNQREPNPLSETGYRSHFVDEVFDGMTDEETVKALTEFAERLVE